MHTTTTTSAVTSISAGVAGMNSHNQEPHAAGITFGAFEPMENSSLGIYYIYIHYIYMISVVVIILYRCYYYYY